MTQPPVSPEQLRPVLQAAEKELADRLAQACENTSVSEETTGELMRLEENLIDAAQAAKTAISLRRRIRTQRAAEGTPAAGPARPGASRAERRTSARAEPRAAAPSAAPPATPTPDVATEGAAVPAAAAPAAEAPESGVHSAIREFTDSRGVQWRVWAVTPEQMNRRTRSEAYMGEYRDGWLAFESFDGTERRRLPHFPTDWDQCAVDKLEALMQRAEVARGRKNSPPRGTDATGR